MKNLYVIKPISEKEILAVNALLLKMREEEEHNQKIKFHKNEITLAINNCLDDLGVPETKHLVRSLVKELRELKEN